MNRRGFLKGILDLIVIAVVTAIITAVGSTVYCLAGGRACTHQGVEASR